MIIKFVGTGSGKTSLNRFHSSFIIEHTGVDNPAGVYNLLVDAGDGVSRALLKSEISFHQINGILISHLHPDHFAGMNSLLVQMKLNERKEDLDIFVNESVIEVVKRSIIQSYIFIENMGFDVNFKAFNDEEKTIVINDLYFISRQNRHIEKYKKFDPAGLLNFSCSSFLFVDENKSVFYSGDIGDKKDLLLFNDWKLNLMISEISHVTLSEVLDSFLKQNPERLVLTHISDEDEKILDKFFESLDEPVSKRIFRSYDGLVVSI